MKRLLLSAVALLALASCKTVKFEDGEVPSQYLAQAKKLEGVYQGSFQGLRGKMIVSFEGNRPYVRMVDTAGGDLVLPHCRANIHQLKWAYINNKKQVKSVGFYFHPGSCFVEGRELVLDFNKDYNVITASVLDRRLVDRRCRWEVYDPRRGPQEVCEYVTRDIYLTGKFSR